MDDATRAKLNDAYELVKLKDFAAARPLIFDVILKDKDNLDAWWLSVFVATKDEDKVIALYNVLRLNPNHHAAREMMVRLERKSASQPKPDPLRTATLLPQRSAVPTRRKIRWGVWTLRFAGLLCFAFAGLIVVDNFLGGRILQPAERVLFGDPDASVWVNATRGGETTQDVDRQFRIPVTKEIRLDHLGDFQFDVIRQDEAHLYHFRAYINSTIMVMANFTSGGASDIVAVELWDSEGRVIAREEQFNDLLDQIENPTLREQLGSLLSVRAIQFLVPQTGSYSIAIVSRAGGPAGNYTLLISTLEGLESADWSQYTR